MFSSEQISENREISKKKHEILRAIHFCDDLVAILENWPSNPEDDRLSFLEANGPSWSYFPEEEASIKRVISQVNLGTLPPKIGMEIVRGCAFNLKGLKQNL